MWASPRRPSANGRPPSRQHLKKRIRYHYRGNAEGSTLRLTLGCVLGDSLGLELRRVGSGTRRTFGSGEHRISSWMEDNARVCWLQQDEPWALEDHLLYKWSLPLNLQGNKRHPFHPRLSTLRRDARAWADEQPILR